MKKSLIAVLLSALIAAPAFAENTAKASPQKPAATTPAKGNYGHMMPGPIGGCDAEHNMGVHYGYGMMGGYGAGMMGGYGGGMMAGPDTHLLATLSLSKEQQEKINKISDGLKHDNWATMGLMNDETAKLRDLYQADKRDPAAIDAEYQKVFELKRQMIKTYLEAENKIEDVLTSEQLAKLKEARSQMRRMYMH